MKFRHCLLLIIISLFFHRGYGQNYILSGKVIDSVTGAPLAFVNIVAGESNFGTTTDIDGRFLIKTPHRPDSLRLSYVGYAPRTFVPGEILRNLVIPMTRKSIELSAVTIFPGENPAHQIIRKVMINRDRNNPEKIPGFTYNCYNKITAEWYLDKTRLNLSTDPDYIKDKNDSIFHRLSKQSDDQYIMLLESYSQRLWLNGRSHEKVIGTRISGFSDPNFTSLATDIQPFSFYDDYFSLSITDVKDYLNPVADGSIGRYSFLLEDTIYEANDSIFVISFRPAPGKLFNGLKGVLYINTNGYALQNVIAEPADQGLWSIRIQQKYAFVDNLHWFPVQLNYDWIVPNYPSDKVGVVLHGRSYISDVNFSPGLRRRDFGPDDVSFGDNAGKQNEVFWQQKRHDSLTRKEQKTYAVMDSTGKKLKFNYLSRVADRILDGYLPIGPVDFSLNYLFQYNNIEGIRAGLGLRTNEKIARWFTAGAYFGYGFWDRQWKYGGELSFTLWRKHDLKISGIYVHDIESPALTEMYLYRNNSYWYDYLINRVDYIDRYSAAVKFRVFRYFQFEVAGIKESRDPSYDYAFVNPGIDTLASGSFDFTELRAGLRFAYRDKLVQAFNRRVSMGTNYPVLYLTWVHGFNGLLGGSYLYDKVELALEKSFIIKHLGTSSFALEAGHIWGEVPYTKLFRGKGSYSSSFMIYFRNTFQTMRVDEFAYDTYASLHFTHNFGSRIVRLKKFRPELILSQSVLWGTLSDPARHQLIDFKVPDKWYFESGFIIDNFVRINLLNLMYVKLGLGAFYRYGYYSFDNVLKNAAFKLSVKFSGSR